MRAAIYIRVGNEEQSVSEIDMKKLEQEFENFCEMKKHQTVGEYILKQQDKKSKGAR